MQRGQAVAITHQPRAARGGAAKNPRLTAAPVTPSHGI